MARFEYIGMVAHDMAATLRFYRLLGMDIPAGVEQEAGELAGVGLIAEIGEARKAIVGHEAGLMHPFGKPCGKRRDGGGFDRLGPAQKRAQTIRGIAQRQRPAGALKTALQNMDIQAVDPADHARADPFGKRFRTVC